MNHRYLPTELTIEARDGKPPMIHGYAAVYYTKDDPGSEFRLWEGAVERVMPGAFDKVLSESHDVVALYNHDENLPLGRTSSGTLKLSNDSRGLRYSIDPPDTTYARDLTAAIQRGDVKGSSFGFFPPKRGEAAWRTEGGKRVRELRSLRIRDIGPATTGAYASADTWVRSDSELAEIRCSCEAEMVELEVRGAVPYAAGPMIDSDSWDGPAAEKLVASWASNGDTMDWSKYRRAFAWYDSADPNVKGAYKLQHHTIQNGELKVDRKGVIAAMGALLGARGGVDIPEGDEEAVFRHLSRHYEQFKMEPPEFDKAKEDATERSLPRSVIVARATLAELGL